MTPEVLYYTRIICIIMAIFTLFAIICYIFLPCIYAFYNNCLPDKDTISCCCIYNKNTDSATVVPVEDDEFRESPV